MKEIAEADDGKFGKGGKEEADGSKAREEAVDEVIGEVKRDPDLDEHR